MLPNASACCVCGERDHTSSKCPTLHSPLTPGFYTGGGGGGGHSHDDDESLYFLRAATIAARRLATSLTMPCFFASAATWTSGRPTKRLAIYE
jgi:hypothetical protein